MAAKVRRPEDLSTGDWVHVVIDYGQGDGRMVKRKRAKVKSVLRKAAVLTEIEGEKKDRTVRFNELELIPLPPQPQGPRRRRRQRGKLRAVPPSFAALEEPPPDKDEPEVIRRPRSATEPLAELECEPEPVAAPEPLDYDSWAAKGLSIQAQLIEKAKGLDDELRAVLAEQIAAEEKVEEIKRRLAAKEEELTKVRNKIALLESLQEDLE